MIFECVCKRCFAEYEVGRDDIMRGSRWWTICPACRLADAAELPTAQVTEGDEFDGSDAA